MEDFQLMILAVVITNDNKTGRTDVSGRTVYFVNNWSQMFNEAMSVNNILLTWLNFDQ
jgi:hypothetical protein